MWMMMMVFRRMWRRRTRRVQRRRIGLVEVSLILKLQLYCVSVKASSPQARVTLVIVLKCVEVKMDIGAIEEIIPVPVPQSPEVGSYPIICVPALLKFNEFFRKYGDFDGEHWPKFNLAFQENRHLEKLDILGSSFDQTVEVVSKRYDLDSIMIVASAQQMVNMFFPNCVLDPWHSRECKPMPLGRSRIQVPMRGEPRLISECVSRMLFVCTWGEIGRIQVYSLASSLKAMNDFNDRFNEALCDNMTTSSVAYQCDIPFDVSGFHHEPKNYYRQVHADFLKEVFVYLGSRKENSNIRFYIVGHDLKRNQPRDFNVQSLWNYVSCDVLNSHIDLGCYLLTEQGDEKYAVFPHPMYIKDQVESAAQENRFEWGKITKYPLLGCGDLVGLSATESTSENFIKLKLYSGTLEKMSTDSTGIKLHHYKFNVHGEVKKHPLTRKFLKEFDHGKQVIYKCDDELDSLLASMTKSGRQNWDYRMEISVKIGAFDAGIRYLDSLKQRMVSDLVILKSSWVALHSVALIETLRQQGKRTIRDCPHRLFEKANTLKVVNEVLRNYITGCKPRTKVFTKQLEKLQLFRSMELYNVPRILFTDCHVQPFCFLDSTYFLGIRDIVSNLVKSRFQVEMSCLAIFVETVNQFEDLTELQLCQMILMQYLAWTFTSLKKSCLIKTNAHFRYGPFKYVSRRFKSNPRLNMITASKKNVTSDWCSQPAKIPKERTNVDCKDFLAEEFLKDKGRSYQGLMKLVMRKYSIDESRMRQMLQQILISHQQWKFFQIPKSPENEFRKKYKLKPSLVKLRFTKPEMKAAELMDDNDFPVSLQPGNYFFINDLTKSESEAAWKSASDPKKKKEANGDWTEEELAIVMSLTPKDKGSLVQVDYRPLFKSILGGFVRKDGDRIIVRRSLGAMKVKMNLLRQKKYENLRNKVLKFSIENRIQLRRAILNYAFYGSPYKNIPKEKEEYTSYIDDRLENPLSEYLVGLGIKQVSSDVMQAIKLLGEPYGEFEVVDAEDEINVEPFDFTIPSIFKEKFSFIYENKNSDHEKVRTIPIEVDVSDSESVQSDADEAIILTDGDADVSESESDSFQSGNDAAPFSTVPEADVNVSAQPLNESDVSLEHTAYESIDEYIPSSDDNHICPVMLLEESRFNFTDNFPESSDPDTETETSDPEEGEKNPDKQKKYREFFLNGKCTVRHTKPDGNCGFRASGRALNMHPRKLRKQMLKEVNDNEWFYRQISGIHFMPFESLKERLNNFVREPTKRYWFNLKTALVLSNMTRRPVVILSQSSLGCFLTFVPLRPRTDSDPKANYEPIVVLYTVEHYLSIEGEMRIFPNYSTVGGKATVAEDFQEFVDRNRDIFVYRPPSLGGPPPPPNPTSPQVM
jgi:hypothetical protein